MRKDPAFTAIDMNTWPMAQTFYYYTEIAPTSYTVNVMMDVTTMRNELKTRKCKFFPAYIYLVTRNISRHPEFRVAVKDGVLGHWEYLTPTYPQLHQDNKTTSLLWTEYEDCFQSFYERYLEDTKTHGNSHGILTSKGRPLPNAYIVSCIPWFHFNSFSLHNHGLKDYYLPSFEAGGFSETNGKVQMPLSITVHHATTEGYHLKVFLEQLQYDMDHTEEWLEVANEEDSNE
jgi:chloramphenicol O-acetyltransferase type A